MSLAGEEEKETCTRKRLRSHDSTTAWGSSSSDAADAAGDEHNALYDKIREDKDHALGINARVKQYSTF